VASGTGQGKTTVDLDNKRTWVVIFRVQKTNHSRRGTGLLNHGSDWDPVGTNRRISVFFTLERQLKQRHRSNLRTKHQVKWKEVKICGVMCALSLIYNYAVFMWVTVQCVVWLFICFVSFALLCFNYSFYVFCYSLYVCYLVLYVLMYILWVLYFCIVLCIVCCPHVYSCFCYIYVHVYWPLPSGENAIAVLKYHTKRGAGKFRLNGGLAVTL
jgi:hypothetical protein